MAENKEEVKVPQPHKLNRFKTWLLKIVMGSLKELDKDGNGKIEATISYDIKTKDVSFGIK